MISAQFANELNTCVAVTASDGRVSFVPVDPSNMDYAALAGVTIQPFAATAPTDADVTREYERRLCLTLGARDLAHAAFIRADDNAEIRGLQAASPGSVEESARLSELLLRDASVVALISKYNAMPSPPPSDYAADRHWV